MNKKRKKDFRHRFRQMIRILREHEVIRGMTPQKLRLILEDLGPVYIKLGQIMSMQTEILPKAFCDELTKLRTEVKPMPIQQVEEVIEEAYGQSITSLFSEFSKEPVGSASIAQVHLAKLKTDGKAVVVKIQRQGIYELMRQDIWLLKKAARVLKHIENIHNVIDLEMVLDELWETAKEELNFLKEAENATNFAKLNETIMYVRSPKINQELTVKKSLVMEYIGGIYIDDTEALKNAGYDLKEIASLLAENYVKQVIDDGFFHADPHPGNIKVYDGKIVWLDLGMMGRLTLKDKRLLEEAIQAVAFQDIGRIKEVVISMGRCKEEIDHPRLYEDIERMMDQYASSGLGEIPLTDLIEDLLNIASKHHISMPSGISILSRGVITIEGLLAHLDPDIDFMSIASGHLKYSGAYKVFGAESIKKKLFHGLESGERLIHIPILVADLLKMMAKGQAYIGANLKITEDAKKFTDRLVNRMIMGMMAVALVVGSSLLATVDLRPKLFSLPLYSIIGYLIVLVLSIILIRNK